MTHPCADLVPRSKEEIDAIVSMQAWAYNKAKWFAAHLPHPKPVVNNLYGYIADALLEKNVPVFLQITHNLYRVWLENKPPIWKNNLTRFF